MKIRYSLLILVLLFPFVSKSEQNTLTTRKENVISKLDFTNVLTPKDRTDLITTIKIVMKILVDNTHLEAQKKSKFFDSFDLYYPKNGPVNMAYLTKKNLLVVSLYYDTQDKVILNRGGISFDHKKFNTNELSTLFALDDFDKRLDLTFEGANKEIVEYKGKEIGSYYLYTYHWKLNPKLKVMFRVENKFFIEKDDYPRNFFMVNLQLEP